MSDSITREEAKELIDTSEICVIAVGSVEHVEGAQYSVSVDAYMVIDE